MPYFPLPLEGNVVWEKVLFFVHVIPIYEHCIDVEGKAKIKKVGLVRLARGVAVRHSIANKVE